MAEVEMSERGEDQQTGWFDDPQHVSWLIRALIAVCVLSVVADLFYDKHAEFHFRELFGFDAVYGFVCYVLLVLIAKQLRKVLMRPEDYYD
jgi:hypothetical protein